MLTIQPNFTHRSNRVLSFKSGYSVNSEEDKKYKSKTDFYEQQTNEFDEMINDKQTPDYMKKIFKGFKVLSEALFEGWLVMWGASKGSKFVKDGVIQGANSKFTKELKNIMKPITKGLQTAKSVIGKSITEGVERFKNSEFLQKINNNFIGKQVVKVFELIGKGFNVVGKAIKAGYNAIAKPFKGKTTSEIYDKAAKATGTTLGVGAGAAGAYNAATRPDGKENATKDNNNDADIHKEYQEEVERLEEGE